MFNTIFRKEITTKTETIEAMMECLILYFVRKSQPIGSINVVKT